MLIAVINQKGGCGKTTTHVHLTCRLAELGYRVAAIDADNGQGAAVKWLHGAAPGLPVATPQSSDELIEVLDNLTPHADFILFDAAPGLGPMEEVIVPRADKIIIPSGPSEMDLDPTLQAVEFCELLGRPRDTLTMSLNRFQVGYTESREALAWAAKHGLTWANSVIRKCDPFSAAYKARTCIWRMKASNARIGADEMLKLFNEVFPDVRQQNASVPAAEDESPAGGHREPGDAEQAGGGGGVFADSNPIAGTGAADGSHDRDAA